MALPQQLSHIRTTQTQNRAHTGYAYPATYPIWFPQHLALQPHPYAGQPDIDMLAKLLFPDFVEHVNQTSGYAPIRAPPKGLVSEVDTDTHLDFILETSITDDDDSVLDISAIDAKHIKPGFKCNLCNGDMHGVYTRMADGSVITCATKLLGNKVSKPMKTEHVKELTDAEIAVINKFRKYKRSASKKKIAAITNQSTSSDAILSTTTLSDGNTSQSGVESDSSEYDGIAALTERMR